MKQKAFTLMELMIVIVIIGILAAVGMVMFGGQSEKAKIAVSQANLKKISKWLTAQSIEVCSAKQGGGKNGMFLEDGNYKTFIRCSDDGTDLAYAASQYFHKNIIFENPYTGENAIPDKAISSSFNITRNGLKSVSSSYVSKGEIMFFNLGGESMSVVFSNIGGKNGSDKKDWQIIPAPSNF
tara:strand:+ start:469 stop:1014 length:546 start_codon:yes stop_codon:yes gene_type:complete